MRLKRAGASGACLPACPPARLPVRPPAAFVPPWFQTLLPPARPPADLVFLYLFVVLPGWVGGYS